MSLLDDIRIVLVETSHPGNIGATARAMKNMGLSSLRLVNPQDYPSVSATARASGADDILEHATVYDNLDDAIAETCLVIGASARYRRLAWPQLTPREMAQVLIERAQQGQVPLALMFGRENNGLSNEELDRCQYLVQIPANPDYSSLNLAAAVQVLTYEIRMAYLERSEEVPVVEHDSPVADAQTVARFYEHLEQVLLRLQFINEEQPVKLLRRIRRLFNRSELEQKEIQILRGILSAVEKAL